jgi:hypothetical protein
MNRWLLVLSCLVFLACEEGPSPAGDAAPTEWASAASALSAQAADQAGAALRGAGPACPGGCSGHGECWFGRCFCELGYGGDDCGQAAQCPAGCSGNGVCSRGRCFCDPGYGGGDCGQVAPAPCPNECSGKGVCAFGRCFCVEGAAGDDCGAPAPCPNECSGKGVCAFGRCFCVEGSSGSDCSLAAPCPNECNGKGVCSFGQCFCVEGYAGADCGAPAPSPCPNACNGKGVCSFGQCFCVEGSAGDDCGAPAPAPCPNECSGKGVCSFGQCFCVEGSAGDDCGAPAPAPCPNECSGKGVCSFGKCFCVEGSAGDDCGAPAPAPCPNECSGKGVCSFGKCFCVEGYAGDDCGAPVGGETRFAVLAPAEGWEALSPEETGAYTLWSGFVLLNGQLSGPAQVKSVGWLPESAAPPVRRILLGTSDSGLTRVDVLPDGAVVWVGAAGGWLSLDGVVVPRGGEPLQPERGFGGFLEGTAPLQLWADGGGICVLSGTVRSQLPTGTNQVGTLPQRCRPATRLVFAVAGHNGPTRLDVLADGRVFVTDGGDWLSLDGVLFASAESAATPIALADGWEPVLEPLPEQPEDLVGAPLAHRLGGGLCVLSGTVRSTSGSTTIGRLPSACRPATSYLRIGGGSLSVGDDSAFVIEDATLRIEGSLVPLGEPGAGPLVLGAVRFWSGAPSSAR